ncbi:uncharacterized protein LOC119402400 isoform X3 [Rhipicephalus sanguineus]|uniref:uncharacterized protein LOC119402400 isoform X1 n=1 Tax=Rhipicephalus sanguineus TaxID=34632 RepID=UPI001893D4DE|nr:uncharacterized protein LOC119402400 isoform X1 [Rhipicephalus sanguineus]XP_049274580.1 uncharacterized protein LOC119402400 isoform X2 [Rhipicephalus sanguineus]XP_049274581.1 uncharacterized protein LOC119402400 isoform X3 [Rhipicephalus sanguineus]
MEEHSRSVFLGLQDRTSLLAMTRAVIIALLFALTVLAVASAQRRRFNFNFQPPAPRHRFNVEASGGGRNHRNFNVGGSVHGEYDLYRSRGGTRVVASGGVAHGATRIDGKTYKGRPQGSVGIGVEIPIGKGR